jgi:hypothetical protein
MEGLVEGAIVRYVLTPQDVSAINQQRAEDHDIRERTNGIIRPAGTRVINTRLAVAGEVMDMTVMRIVVAETGLVNGKIPVDSVELWITGSAFGTGMGTWHFPERVPDVPEKID